MIDQDLTVPGIPVHWHMCRCGHSISQHIALVKETTAGLFYAMPCRGDKNSTHGCDCMDFEPRK